MLLYMYWNATAIEGWMDTSFVGPATGMIITSMLGAVRRFAGGVFNLVVGLIGPRSGRRPGSIEDIWIYWDAWPFAAFAALGCLATSMPVYMLLYATTIKGLVGTSFLGPATAVIITSML